MIKEFKTRTGAIFCDTEKKMEYLYVGDYGKENNIKADFLGFKKEINQVSHRKVDLKDKMVVTISTQKGCPMNCMFCDCPKVKFGGNISREELAEEVVNAIKFSKCEYTERFNLHLARMGEPSLNAANVLNFLKYDLRDIVNANMKADVIHPVFTTMMPKSLGVEGMGQILDAFCQIKNEDYDGEAGLQLSINSTDEKQRKELFRGLSMSLEDIASVARNLPKPKGRKYTLNFPVTDKTILDPKELSRLFDKDKFIVKITPIHETNEANANGINTPDGYYKYDVYRQFEQPLLDEGWEVIVFIPSKEEDEDRITCGNALLSTYNKH
jgi:23S rRNA (adenine2503-C2)-methyltransferase